jgi:hypothetical protein
MSPGKMVERLKYRWRVSCNRSRMDARLAPEFAMDKPEVAAMCRIRVLSTGPLDRTRGTGQDRPMKNSPRPGIPTIKALMLAA